MITIKNFEFVVFERCAILSAITFNEVKGIKFVLTSKTVGDQTEISVIGRTMKGEPGSLVEDGFSIEPSSTQFTTVPKPENDFKEVYFDSEKIMDSLKSSRTHQLTLKRYLVPTYENLELVNANPEINPGLEPSLMKISFPQTGQSNPPMNQF